MPPYSTSKKDIRDLKNDGYFDRNMKVYRKLIQFASRSPWNEKLVAIYEDGKVSDDVDMEDCMPMVDGQLADKDFELENESTYQYLIVKVGNKRCIITSKAVLKYSEENSITPKMLVQFILDRQRKMKNYHPPSNLMDWSENWSSPPQIAFDYLEYIDPSVLKYKSSRFNDLMQSIINNIEEGIKSKSKRRGRKSRSRGGSKSKSSV